MILHEKNQTKGGEDEKESHRMGKKSSAGKIIYPPIWGYPKSPPCSGNKLRADQLRPVERGGKKIIRACPTGHTGRREEKMENESGNPPGRVEWMKRKKVWKIIGYFKKKEIEIGRAVDQRIACEILRNWYEENKAVLPARRGENKGGENED